MFTFKKPKRNVRQRKVCSSSEEEEDGIAVVKAREAAAAKPSLSFHDEEDEEGAEIFQVKKSSTSRRLMKQKKRREKDPPPSPPTVEIEFPLEPPVSFVEKTVEKESWTLTGLEAEALHMEEEDEDQDENDEDSDDSIKKILQKGAIPDAAAIHAARKKREAARQRGDVPGNNNGNSADCLGGNFIPLQDSRKRCSGKSRLVRDDEHDDDGDEERIAFNGLNSEASQRAIDRQSLQNEYEDEPEEDNHWEEQQIRKAVKNNSLASAESLFKEDQELVRESSLLDINREAVINKPLSSYNLDGIRCRIQDRLKSLNETKRRHSSDMELMVDDLIRSRSEIKRLEIRIPELAERHRFFQDLRGYVTDLVECFDEKLINIKYLEDKMNKSKLEILNKLTERRRQDVRDQMIELSSKKPPATNIDTSENTEEAQRTRRAAEREGRRRRRREQRNKHLPVSAISFSKRHDEGMSSDDEMSSLDVAGISKIRRDVETQARTILSDVVDEFCTIDGISERLHRWKVEDFDSYNDAYVSLCLPKIFSPLVRLQLLFWNPLTEHADITTMEWYKSLTLYSFREKESFEDLKCDPDKRLLPMIIEKVLIPKTTGLIKSGYDPASSSQTSKVVGFLNKLISDYPTIVGDSKQVRELLMTVKEKIKSSVDNDVYIPLGYSKNLLDSMGSGHYLFFHRQFWNCFKLFRNILSWHGIFSDSVISEMAVSSVLNRYLLIALGINPDPMDSIDKCRMIISTFPSKFLTSSEEVHSDLIRFVQFLTTTLPSIRKGSLGRDSILEIVKLLKILQFKDEAETFRKNKL